MAKSKNCVASQPRNSTSLTTFTLFPNLFPELRSKIWELAIFNEPRNIIIGKYRPWKKREGHPRWSEDFGYKCTSTVPAVLRTCTEARTKGLKYYNLLEWAPEISKGKVRLIKVPEYPARTYINWKVDRIVIDHVEDFWTNSLCIFDYEVGKVQNFRKLHNDDRSSAYDLAQKLIENGVKFLAVDTGNDSDKIEFFFESVYPWGCPVEELIFFSSGQTKFTSRFYRTWGARQILPWSTFRQPKVRDSSKEPTLAYKFLVDRFKVHGEGRGVMLPHDGEIPQTAGQEMPKLVTPMGHGGRDLSGRIFSQFRIISRHRAISER
ncbi:hypothetical protein BPAE_0086g00240 [Botrytis paeoniae]|uniref:2EXR domain-containing protein n=1 Tax=Botrytis paeoniae TaxID=278948 RepID=A0A4Z1FQA4_9HELO|nr:hypothetical protein BPAE_0086g00240 [Botrytis paeoniae]